MRRNTCKKSVRELVDTHLSYPPGSDAAIMLVASTRLILFYAKAEKHPQFRKGIFLKQYNTDKLVRL